MVEHGDAVRQVERVMVGQAAHTGTEFDGARTLQGGADEDVWRRNVLPLGREVLADPGLVEPQLVEPLDL